MRITGEDLQKGVLTFFVVYDHPRDYPAGWVVRAQAAIGGMIFHSKWANTFDSLAAAQAFCEQRGLTRLPRSEGDDPVIVESWV